MYEVYYYNYNYGSQCRDGEEVDTCGGHHWTVGGGSAPRSQEMSLAAPRFTA